MDLHEETISLQTRLHFERLNLTEWPANQMRHQEKFLVLSHHSTLTSHHRSRRATCRSKVRQWLAIKDQNSACDSWKDKFIF